MAANNHDHGCLLPVEASMSQYCVFKGPGNLLQKDRRDRDLAEEIGVSSSTSLKTILGRV
jgi:hypothetical protein